jgi:hypothetical protein
MMMVSELPTHSESLTSASAAGGTQTSHRTDALRVSFVVPVLNDATGLDRCLASIQRNDYPRELVELIVADNGSTDESIAVARRHGALVLDLSGVSVADMRNHAARVAAGDVIAFVDSDHELSGDWLRVTTAWFRDPSVGGVGAPYSIRPTATWVERMGNGIREHRTSPGDTDWLPTGNLLVRKAAFDRCGGFDNTLVTCEDVDFCRRLKRSGFRLVNDPEAWTIHYGDPRTLHDLFKGELWRGRDNLRVSLREPLTLRAAPGVLFPPLFLSSVVALPLAAMLFPFGGAWLLGLLGAVLAALVVLRTAVVLRRVGCRGLGDVAQGVCFSTVYEAARAFALVVRKEHRRANRRSQCSRGHA